MPSLPFIIMEGGVIRLMAFKELMLPESESTCILYSECFCNQNQCYFIMDFSVSCKKNLIFFIL